MLHTTEKEKRTIRPYEMWAWASSIIGMLASFYAAYLLSVVQELDQTVTRQDAVIDSLQRRSVPDQLIDTVLNGKPYVLLPLTSTKSRPGLTGKMSR